MNSKKKLFFRLGLSGLAVSMALFLLLPSLAGAWNNNSLVIKTNYGKLKGVLSNDGNTMIWKGVPYAKPPVGDLRWKASQNPQPWSGLMDATKPAPKCTQLYTTVDWIRTGAVDPDSSEDCLYVDIYRPNSSKRLPVYVWIHGGSNNFGSAREYSAAVLATRADMVVVVVQYRLGPLGWLYHPALQSGTDPISDSGNFGTTDHAQALRWVQGNIEAFGGDSHNVTVGGESAGAHNTMNMVISPLGKGLFHRALYESGGMAPVPVSAALAQANNIILYLVMYTESLTLSQAQDFLAAMSLEELKAYLYAADAGDLFKAILAIAGALPTFPIAEDGVVMPQDGWLPAIQAGRYNKMPIILGSNEFEMKSFMPLYGGYVKALFGVPPGPYSWLSLFASVRNNNVPDYMAVLPTSFDRDLYDRTGYFGSLQWKAKNVDSIAHALSMVQDKVYAYLFRWPRVGVVAGQTPFDFIYGAGHAAEIPFFFGGDKGLFDLPDLTAPGTRALQNAMMGYLANFARTGNPNSGDSNQLFPRKRTKWPQWSYAPGDPKAIVFDADYNQATITTTNEEVTFATAEAERVAWVADNGGPNSTADYVTKFFLWQPPW
jgi:para-nitrobenzyl esterase